MTYDGVIVGFPHYDDTSGHEDLYLSLRLGLRGFHPSELDCGVIDIIAVIPTLVKMELAQE